MAQQHWDLLSNHNFDVVILDVMLPDINGIEICRRLRAAKLCSILFVNRFGKYWKYNKRIEFQTDDYLLKHLKELDESQRTFQTGRSNTKTEWNITIADLQIQFETKSVIKMEIPL
jgi:DNA-binding response OmpR family regulator